MFTCDYHCADSNITLPRGDIVLRDYQISSAFSTSSSLSTSISTSSTFFSLSTITSTSSTPTSPHLTLIPDGNCIKNLSNHSLTNRPPKLAAIAAGIDVPFGLAGSSIISSSLSGGPSPGMPSQGREQQAASLQRKVGLGAKSLDRDLDDVHTWPYSRYLMRQCNGVGGWVQLKYRLCRCECECEMCRCKINDLMRKETGNSLLFYPPGPLTFLTFFTLLTPIRLPHPHDPFPLSGSHIRSVLFYYPRSVLRFLEIAGGLRACSRNCIGCASAGLQFHRRILALGLTERAVYILFNRMNILSCYRSCIKTGKTAPGGRPRDSSDPLPLRMIRGSKPHSKRRSSYSRFVLSDFTPMKALLLPPPPCAARVLMSVLFFCDSIQMKRT